MGHSNVTSKSLRHFIITGRVQGVGFRRFVQAVGRELGLHGAVRNLEDGRVESIVRADSEQLPEFEKRIATGPAGSKVIDIVAVDREASDDLMKLLLSDVAGDFSIQSDGRREWF